MFLNPGDSSRGQQMNSQAKPMCIRIPAGRDKFRVLNFNEGSFTKVQAGHKEFLPVMVRAEDCISWKL